MVILQFIYDEYTPSQAKGFKNFTSSRYFEDLERAWNEGLKLKNLLKWKYKTPLGGILRAGRRARL